MTPPTPAPDATALALALNESGATDWDACWTRYSKRGRNCRCDPKCRVCGFGEHAAIHGPALGQPVGSKPYGHRYQP